MAPAAARGSQRDITRPNRERTLNDDFYLHSLQCLRPWGGIGIWRLAPCVGLFHMGTCYGNSLDEAKTRDALTELVEKEGREIVTASDGEEALERLTEVPRPRVILLDLMMPRMDGWELLRRQSVDPSIANIPTIVLSGSALPAGAKHQLAKPVDVDRLRALVDQYC
jgi:CheY-like chemotaxis protein